MKAVTALALLALAGFQAPSAGRGLILGRVIEATSGAPVRGALVELANTTEPSTTSVLTDADGQFVFTSVPAGKFGLTATRAGYSYGYLGQRRPDDSPRNLLPLGENERRGDVVLRVWKHGAITGTVTNDAGEPLIGVEVRAYRRVFVAGRPRLGADARSGSTDDRGIFRIAQLVAGDYIVSIPHNARSLPASVTDRLAEVERSGSRADAMAIMDSLANAGVFLSPPGRGDSMRMGSDVIGVPRPPIAPNGERLLVYPTVYYADASAVAGARAMTLASGQQLAGIDMVLKSMPAFRVSGRLIDDTGVTKDLPVRLLPGAGTDFSMQMSSPSNATLTDDQGRFTLMAVTPGDYTARVLKGPGGEMGGEFIAIRSSSQGGTVISAGGFEGSVPPPPPQKEPTRFATATVSVGDADVTGLTLTVRNGVRLSGQIEFATSGLKPPAADALRRLHPIVEARDGLTPGFEFEMIASVTDDRKFETVELPPGAYYLRVPEPPDGWVLESVMLGGRDISDVPLDVADNAIPGITIRFTTRPSTLAGTVQASSRDDHLDEAIVVAFPVDRAGWIDFGNTPRRIASAPVSSDGAYSMSGLPAGEYFVAAVRDDMLSDWRNPAFLDIASRVAERITMGAGEQKQQALTMRRIR